MVKPVDGESPFERVGVAALVVSVAASAVLAVWWGLTDDLGMATLIADEQLPLTALWAFVPLVVLAALLAHTKARFAFASAAAAVIVLATVLGQAQGLDGLLLVLAGIAVALAAMPPHWARPLLYLLAGLVAVAPLGYYILPLPAAVLSLSAAVGYGHEARARRPLNRWVVVSGVLLLLALVWAVAGAT